MTIPSYLYSIVDGRGLDDSERKELKDLFDSHYGVWGTAAREPGRRVTIPKWRLNDLLDREDTYVLIAREERAVVGYAIGARVAANGNSISWVTQLVVHSDHQRNGVATRLLRSAWGFSDDYAWGLASANPFAIRALEAATLRRCNPTEIERNMESLREGLPRIAGYLNAPIKIGADHATIDTQFHVSHDKLQQSINEVSTTVPWVLGDLGVGEEWLAVVFQSQKRRDLTVEDLDELCDAGGSVVAEAYDRMAEGAAAVPHVWMRHFESEVDELVTSLNLVPGATILDLGCGNGRHAVEFAARGFRVTAVDRSKVWLSQAAKRAAARGQTVEFILGDARHLHLARTFDAVIALYDVVGSFRREEDNRDIVAAIERHLASDGRFAVSVLNRVVADDIALHRGNVIDEPNLIHAIPPSSAMQDTGGIWDPAKFLADTVSGVFYRRERFGMAGMLPVELLVCDRRYNPDELSSLCRDVGLDATTLRPVRLGAWHAALDPKDLRAKELLCTGVALTGYRS